MKQSAIVAILLTFLSFLLLLGASIVFLLQGRQALEREVAHLQTETESQNLAIAEMQQTAVAREMALATSEAMLATRAVELAQANQLLATRAAEQSAAADLPLVQILSPESGAVVAAGSVVDVVVVAGHAQGIGPLRLTVGERLVTFESPADAYHIFNHTTAALPSGAITITASVTANNQLSNSDAITISVAPAATEGREGRRGDDAIPLLTRILQTGRNAVNREENSLQDGLGFRPLAIAKRS